MSFVIELTAAKGVDFSAPKYFTGRMIDIWPEYVRDPDRAHIFEKKISASETLATFRMRGFRGSVRPFEEVV